MVKFLHDYGEDTLSANAPYHGEFRRLVAARLKTAKLSYEQWTFIWQDNPFLKKAGPRSLRLPIHTRVSHLDAPYLPEEPPGRRNLLLKTSLASLTISTSPYWTILRDQPRAARVFTSPHAAKATFLVIPVELRLVLQGKLIIAEKHLAEYLWFQKLMENARRRLSYGYFLNQEEA